MSLSEHRQAIDKLDAQIVRLLNERTRHVLSIGEIKLAAGEEIYAPHRERIVFERVCGHNSGPITNDQLRAIYREIMSAAIALEKPLSVAYLGPEATNTHAAAIKKFGASVAYQPLGTIADIFTAVEKGEADLAVIPIENSTEGSVRETLDSFVESDLKVVAQIHLEISHALISRSPLEQITRVYSKDQALAQCRQARAVVKQHARRDAGCEPQENRVSVRGIFPRKAVRSRGRAGNFPENFSRP